MIQKHSGGFSLFGLDFPLFKTSNGDDSCESSQHSTFDTAAFSGSRKIQSLKSVRFSDEVKFGIFQQEDDGTVSDCWYSKADMMRFRQEQARALEQVVNRKPEMGRLFQGVFTAHRVSESQQIALCQALGGDRIGLVEELGTSKSDSRRKLLRVLSQHRLNKADQTRRVCEAISERSRKYVIHTAHAHATNLY